MWILIGAVLSASLVGSLHCVGMCGPLAIWPSCAGERQRTSQMTLAVSLYHLGRLLTYATAGLIAGAVGQLADWGGQTLGVQLLAARVVGVLMVLIGGIKLAELLIHRRRGASQLGTGAATGSLAADHKPKSGLGATLSSWITLSLVRLRPYVFRLPIPARGLATGLLTALLPCGWLYLFALLAAGTGHAGTGMLVMVAFWVGTVPALVALVSGLQFLGGRVRQLIPVGAAVLLIVAGFTTASGRGFAKLKSLSELNVPALVTPACPSDTSESHEVPLADTPERLAGSVDELVRTPLPCCAEHQAAPTPQGAQR